MTHTVALYRVAADLSGVEFERSYETVSNGRGLCCISPSHRAQVVASSSAYDMYPPPHHGQVIAFPGPREGSVRLLTRGGGEGSMRGGGGSGSAGLGGGGGGGVEMVHDGLHKRPSSVQCSLKEMVHDGLHKRPIAFLALNRDGSILATASLSGELIRLWGTHQVRRRIHTHTHTHTQIYAYVHT
jgi:hypothetical protein